MQTIPPSGTQYPIRSGDQAGVVVEVGGGLRAYTVADLPIVDGYGDEALAPAGAGQVLAPWPNRIRDGRYPWHGETYELALSEPPHHNAIHGLVRWLPWRAVSVGEAAGALSCELPPHPGDPWRLGLSARRSAGPGRRPGGTTPTHPAAAAAPCWR